MSDLRFDERGNIVESFPTGVKTKFVPPTIPPAPTGRKRTPEAIRYMDVLCRLRGLTEIDFMVAEHLIFDSKKMENKWKLSSGVYHPETQYVKD